MEIRKSHIGRWMAGAVLLLMVALLPVACSEETGKDEGQRRELHVVLGGQHFQDVRSGTTEVPDAESRSTRALPSGFVTYNELYASGLPEHAQIQAFLTSTSGTAPIRGVFSFADDAGKRGWSAQIPMENDGTYYFYGFMPKEDAATFSIAPYNSSYAQGAVLTINGINALTSSDVCVIVGAKRNADNTTPITSLDMASRLGQFDVEVLNEANYLYLLADHLYCSLHFKMKIDAAYNQLRTIKVKQLRLLVSEGSTAVKSVNATVTLVANAFYDAENDQVNFSGTGTRLSPLSARAGGGVSFTIDQTGTADPAVLYDYTTDTTPANSDGLALTTEAQSFRGCLAPSFNEYFILESVYDVYDRKGNPIRENETARNTFRPASMTPGQEYTYTITVNPTYLYMLSEPDLDSPKFSIE